MIAARRLYLLLVLVAVIFALSYRWQTFKYYAIAADALIILLLLIDLKVTVRPNLLSAVRLVADRLSIGRQNRIRLLIRNASAKALLCRVQDVYSSRLEPQPQIVQFKLAAAAEVEIDYAISPRRRGLYKFGRLFVRYRSLLGLFWWQVRLAEEQAVKVYPDLEALKELAVKLHSSAELGELKQNKRGQGTDFAGLKEYAVGDDSRCIDWKATARRDKPIVRSYEIEQEQRLLVLIDAGRMMLSDLDGLTRFDHALNSALALVLAGLAQNDQVGIGIFADKPLLYLPPKRGKDYLQKVLNGVFEIEPLMVEPDYGAMLSHFGALLKGRALVVLLTDLTDPTGSQALSTGLTSLRKRHLPFCVTLNDRAVVKLSQTRVNTDDDATEVGTIFERVVAIDLLAARELALNVLQRQGCLVLDKPPQELSSALVARYLDVKRRGRL
jgi:uncharacterized protein (DUF58 family)